MLEKSAEKLKILHGEVTERLCKIERNGKQSKSFDKIKLLHSEVNDYIWEVNEHFQDLIIMMKACLDELD